ncbi:MAG: hypothetical protein GYA22_09910, partial [Bacteroidales bacterium]|nr:hypothetical protein [Bacteroidales bacterium]
QLPDVEKLPPCSFLVHFSFELAKPYISRDDELLYPSDNPVRKDRLFKVPMIAPSTWKGHLRGAIRTCQSLKREDKVLDRLLGGTGEENVEEFTRGRLFFYPTFFKNIGLEVINPHNRKTKAGTNPIFFECVPTDKIGEFTLLYVPHMALNGIKPGTDQFYGQVREDMDVLLKGISDMMLTYGFSAKKTAGYGAAKDQLPFIESNTPGKILFHLNPKPQNEAAVENRNQTVPEICCNWLDDRGNFLVYDKKERSKKVETREWSKSRLNQYMTAKRVWDEYQARLKSYMVQTSPVEPKVKVLTFEKISELPGLMRIIWPGGGEINEKLSGKS